MPLQCHRTRPPRRFLRDALFSCLAGAALVAPRPAPGAGGSDSARVDFAREILPILSDKCFVCHGPDTRKAGLVRLDSFAGATRDLGGYRAIDPAAPERSEILVRLHDAENPMPPPEAEKHLSDEERGLLARWVRQGGTYARHWAFVPPRRPAPPPLPGAANEVDVFVHARLRERGLDFAPEADRATLARRAALVLTGLPPEPEELEAFLADDRREGSFRAFVEALLASPRFGEHQARYWLDAVRYGDTHGLHLDNRRGIYPYRDWVVRALNRNLPLDEFITWQLAGDLLPEPTLAQRVATGFVRMNPSTSEGGVLPEEFQAKNNFDRVETLGTALLAMTLTCARCHTHKYDPIPQTEYYRLLAFFNSTAENALDGNSYTYGPSVRAPADQPAWGEWEVLEADSRELLASAADTVAARHAELVRFAAARDGWTTSAWRLSEPAPLDAPFPGEKALVATKGLPGTLDAELPPGRARWVAFSVETTKPQLLWLELAGGVGSHVMVDGVPHSAFAGAAAHQERVVGAVALTAGEHRVLARMTSTGAVARVEVRIGDPWSAAAEKKRWDAGEKIDQLLRLADPHGPLADAVLSPRALELARRMALAEARFVTTLVARELEKPRETRLLRRGEYNLPVGDPLEPGILEILGAFPDDAPRNRLGLARWLTSREHPLVARVLVNRMWQRTFGAGLVRTPEDFGVQGQQPTHPELLDWLAVELQASGWDLKHMLRILVTSRTFRQSSAWRRDADDPENRLLARGPGFRLDAEVIRDLALWASGRLDPHMGGEGVKPYQPDGLWLAMAHPASNTRRYVRDHGRRLYRRSVYVYWKRTSPHPMMTLFDAPSRESSCVRRSRTSTALQSLGLLNETQRIEISRALAGRLLRAAPDDAARLDALFGLLACRVPDDGERRACTTLLETLRARYARAPDDARALLAIGDAPRDPSLDALEHAAWAQLVVTVLASDLALLLY